MHVLSLHYVSQITHYPKLSFERQYHNYSDYSLPITRTREVNPFTHCIVTPRETPIDILLRAPRKLPLSHLTIDRSLITNWLLIDNWYPWYHWARCFCIEKNEKPYFRVNLPQNHRSSTSSQIFPKKQTIYNQYFPKRKTKFYSTPIWHLH